ncbi:hypothetical protein PRIPAC_97570 [Pristionchus pacificus]|uniref:Uncharacterized protein n=1 Tax=Pristionchus pacificus TaxID=54126 RepID=A0A2A6BC25_PRIPA|nr:hypothetical protein PRIPAC_97570 [Pristionchus pacificus]|eukprot:PDM63416.1 hypothetical protein PRIPAC_53773 [Pristionchus pacificus]
MSECLSVRLSLCLWRRLDTILIRTRRTSLSHDRNIAYDPSQDPTILNDQTQLTEGRTGMTKTRASRTQDPSGTIQNQTPAFDQTQCHKNVTGSNHDHPSFSANVPATTTENTGTNENYISTGSFIVGLPSSFCE